MPPPPLEVLLAWSDLYWIFDWWGERTARQTGAMFGTMSDWHFQSIAEIHQMVLGRLRNGFSNLLDWIGTLSISAEQSDGPAGTIRSVEARKGKSSIRQCGTAASPSTDLQSYPSTLILAELEACASHVHLPSLRRC